MLWHPAGPPRRCDTTAATARARPSTVSASISAEPASTRLTFMTQGSAPTHTTPLRAAGGGPRSCGALRPTRSPDPLLATLRH